jgi:Ca-activated chloride channel family protein
MKPRNTVRLAAGLLLLINTLAPVLAQSGQRPRSIDPNRPRLDTRPMEPAPSPQKPGQQPQGQQAPSQPGDDSEIIKIDTTLVTIPVSVLDRTGKFVPNLLKRDFRIYEDNVEQSISDFASVEVPFNVVLLIDTSRSTAFRIEEIQRAAVTFVEHLRPADKVMVVSFDDRIYVDTEFTNDRARLRRAIYGTETGGGTKLYDAVDLVLTERLEQMEGRKAIVIFSDGVDTTSRYSNYEASLDLVEESGVLAYPIRYNTQDQFQAGGRGRGGNGRYPPPVITIPFPIPWPAPRTGRRWPFEINIAPQFPRGGAPEDYRRGAEYMQQLADRSGARLYDADTVMNLERAFTQIAEELRHQYALGYYPTNAARDGSYRKLRVRVMRPNLAVRARDGYRAEDAQANANSSSPQQDRNRPKLRTRN